jgi:hypothetical protein
MIRNYSILGSLGPEYTNLGPFPGSSKIRYTIVNCYGETEVKPQSLVLETDVPGNYIPHPTTPITLRDGFSGQHRWSVDGGQTYPFIFPITPSITQNLSRAAISLAPFIFAPLLQRFHAEWSADSQIYSDIFGSVLSHPFPSSPPPLSSDPDYSYPTPIPPYTLITSAQFPTASQATYIEDEQGYSNLLQPLSTPSNRPILADISQLDHPLNAIYPGLSSNPVSEPLPSILFLQQTPEALSYLINDSLSQFVSQSKKQPFSIFVIVYFYAVGASPGSSYPYFPPIVPQPVPPTSPVSATSGNQQLFSSGNSLDANAFINFYVNPASSTRLMLQMRENATPQPTNPGDPGYPNPITPSVISLNGPYVDARVPHIFHLVFEPEPTEFTAHPVLNPPNLSAPPSECPYLPQIRLGVDGSEMPPHVINSTIAPGGHLYPKTDKFTFLAKRRLQSTATESPGPQSLFKYAAFSRLPLSLQEVEAIALDLRPKANTSAVFDTMQISTDPLLPTASAPLPVSNSPTNSTWPQFNHCAFPSFIYVPQLQRYLFAYRGGASHPSADGEICVFSSKTLTSVNPAASPDAHTAADLQHVITFSRTSPSTRGYRDVRIILINKDNPIDHPTHPLTILIYTVAYDPAEEITHVTCVFSSHDGTFTDINDHSQPESHILLSLHPEATPNSLDFQWIWGIDNVPDGFNDLTFGPTQVFGVSYSPSPAVAKNYLFSSEDGIQWRDRAILFSSGATTEGVPFFVHNPDHPDSSQETPLMCIIIRQDGSIPGKFGVAAHPYDTDNWDFVDMNTDVQAPSVITRQRDYTDDPLQPDTITPREYFVAYRPNGANRSVISQLKFSTFPPQTIFAEVDRKVVLASSGDSSYLNLHPHPVVNSPIIENPGTSASFSSEDSDPPSLAKLSRFFDGIHYTSNFPDGKARVFAFRVDMGNQ